MIRAIAAAATDSVVAAAAQTTLEEGGGAVDAVIAGWFAAAGGSPGVLFAPLTLVLAGAGAGARAFDGRSVQPGLGAPRPRGFVRDDDIPPGARVAVPRSLAAIALAHGIRGRVDLGTLSRVGVARAEEVGAKQRAALLRSVGRAAALVLRSREVSRAFFAAGGPVVGGIVTEQDLEAVMPAEVDALVAAAGDGRIATLIPWELPDRSARGADAIVAVDGRGLVAALAYSSPRAQDAIALPGLECSAAPDADPVRRGVTRLSPGTPLLAASPIGVLAFASGLVAAVGASGCVALGVDDFAVIGAGASFDEGLEALRGRKGADLIVAATRDARAARVVVARG